MDRCNLSEKDVEFAKTYLNEDPDDGSMKKINQVKTWLANDSHVRSNQDDFFILRFLRCCKFDVEKAKKKLENYQQLRSGTPEWFSNRDPSLPALREIFRLGVFLPLRKLDNGGRVVIIIRGTVHDPRQHQMADVLKVCLMILDVAARENVPLSLYGTSVILDMQNATLGHALQLTPGVIKRLVHSWQGCYPIRIHSMDFINGPAYLNVVLNIFKSFMNKKLRSRVCIRKSFDDVLRDKIPIECLPLEYGGTDGSIDDLKDYWMARVEENREWFEQDEKSMVEEKRREDERC
ncbi:retinol-binding protein pinta isoform X2 [Orussus abietinus]|uniref:retinol-binding protein pinta isoform X2 n=1 Tax=Orussus abietinus TaxID=222816 RepID=UPI0006267E1A|nr:retinol-binding protein pinta isoform X2 [Orussus abietinus]